MMTGGTGSHGKSPNLGDFGSRRWPIALIAPWNRSLQERLAAGREQLRDGRRRRDASATAAAGAD